MSRLSKLFVPLANRGLFSGLLAGVMLSLACVSSQALGGEVQEAPVAGPGNVPLGQFAPNLSGAEQPARQPVQWVVGPAKVSLGAVAELEIPADYRFADERSARALLEQLRNPVPKKLAGFLIPPSGEWFALVELSEPGYVKDDDAVQLDAEAILSAIRQIATRQRQMQSAAGAPVVESVEWAVEPVYDPTAHRVEWAIKAVSRGNAVVNYVVRQFGRTHVLDFVGVMPAKAGLDLAALKAVANRMSFLQGQRYEDFQAGDKVADLTLAQFLVSQDREAEELAAETQAGNVAGAITARTDFVWLATVFLTLLLVSVVVLVYRAWSRPRRAGVSGAEGIQQAQPVESAKSLGADQSGGNATPADKPVVTMASGQVSVLGRAKGWQESRSERNHRKREKRYMYDKFYSRMIMRLSGSEYGNGGGNGDTEVMHSLPACPLNHSVTMLDFERELATKASALIETQTDLIEVQRKFIEEQRKLIEEQRRLIFTELEHAKNQLELFGK